MLVHRRVNPSSRSPVPIYTPGWRETMWSKVPYPRKQHSNEGTDPPIFRLSVRNSPIFRLSARKSNAVTTTTPRFHKWWGSNTDTKIHWQSPFVQLILRSGYARVVPRCNLTVAVTNNAILIVTTKLYSAECITYINDYCRSLTLESWFYTFSFSQIKDGASYTMWEKYVLTVRTILESKTKICGRGGGGGGEGNHPNA